MRQRFLFLPVTQISCSAAGVSRSTTLVLAYLMASEKMTLKDAWQRVKAIRFVVDPNAGFCRQLAEFERDLFKRNTVDEKHLKYGFHPEAFQECDSDILKHL